MSANRLQGLSRSTDPEQEINHPLSGMWPKVRNCIPEPVPSPFFIRRTKRTREERDSGNTPSNYPGSPGANASHSSEYPIHERHEDP